MTITADIIIFVVALMSVAGGIFWRLVSVANTLRIETAMVRAELNEFKLEATERYASIKHLKDVESRLVTAVEKLSDRIDKLIEVFQSGQPLVPR